MSLVQRLVGRGTGDAGLVGDYDRLLGQPAGRVGEAFTGPHADLVQVGLAGGRVFT